MAVADYVLMEKNARRLISRCQDYTDPKSSKGVKLPLWKLEEYVFTLDNCLSELQNLIDNGSTVVDKDLLKTLFPRRDILKQLLDTRKKEMEQKRQVDLEGPSYDRQQSIGSTTGDYHQLMEPKYSARDELLGKNEESGLKHRSHPKRDFKDDIEQVMQKHKQLQEQIAKDMLNSISALKHSSLTAKQTIENDIHVIDHASVKADKNIDNLEHETERIQEQRKRSCSWTILIFLLLVFATFLGMVMFIKIT